MTLRKHQKSLPISEQMAIVDEKRIGRSLERLEGQIGEVASIATGLDAEGWHVQTFELQPNGSYAISIRKNWVDVIKGVPSIGEVSHTGTLSFDAVTGEYKCSAKPVA